MEEMILDMALTIVKHFVKNPQSADKFKTALLGIRNAINDLFPGA